MSSRLIEQIESIRCAIEANPEIYLKGKKGERNTLEHLVRPLFHSLGWPYRKILSEEPVLMGDENEDFADYVLFHDKEPKPVLVVEGKRLGADVGEDTDPTKQLRRYLIGLDCHFGVTTNGQQWYLWKRKGYGMDCIWSVDLLEIEPAAAMEAFDDIHYATIPDLEKHIELREVRRATLESVWREMLENRELQIEALSSALKSQVDRIDEGLGIEESHTQEYLSDLYGVSTALIHEPPSVEEIADRTKAREVEHIPSPRYLVIKDERIPISEVYEILTKTAGWLIDNDYLSQDDCPVQVVSGSRAFRYLVNTSPVHSNSQKFTAPREIGQGMYIETHYNRELAQYYATKLLREFLPSEDLKTEI